MDNPLQQKAESGPTKKPMIKNNAHRKTLPWLDSELFQLGKFKLCYSMIARTNDTARPAKDDVMLLHLPGGASVRETVLSRRYPNLAAIRPKKPRTGVGEGFL